MCAWTRTDTLCLFVPADQFTVENARVCKDVLVDVLGNRAVGGCASKYRSVIVATVRIDYTHNVHTHTHLRE
jgi:hypothetical protein